MFSGADFGVRRKTKVVQGVTFTGADLVGSTGNVRKCMVLCFQDLWEK